MLLSFLSILPSIMSLGRPPQEKEFDACKASAAGMLAFRPHTRSELTIKLTDKGYDKACIERSINRLQELVGLFLIRCHTAGCTLCSRLTDVSATCPGKFV